MRLHVGPMRTKAPPTSSDAKECWQHGTDWSGMFSTAAVPDCHMNTSMEPDAALQIRSTSRAALPMAARSFLAARRALQRGNLKRISTSLELSGGPRAVPTKLPGVSPAILRCLILSHVSSATCIRCRQR